MKKITLLIALIAFQFNYAQDTCVTSGTASAGVTSVGAIDGTVDNVCAWGTAGTFGEWYAYTPNFDGVVTVSSDLPQNDGTTNSDDTRLSIFTGTCGGLTCLGGSDDVSSTNFLTTANFAVENGTTYYLHWDDRWSALPFDFEITEEVVNCQDGTLPFTDDFSDPNTLLVCWERLDEDNDGFGWFTADYDIDGNMVPDGNPMLGSASWDANAGAINPDNWLISQALDLSSFDSNDVIELTWDARGIDPDFAAENYSVYAANSNSIVDLTASGTIFTETLASNDPDMDGNGNFESRILDISALAGNMTVYIAFRHHNVSDQFVLNIDNIAVTATLGVNDFEVSAVTYNYNKELKTLNIESSNVAMTNIEVYSILGQKVVTKPLDNSNESIDISFLNDGVYIARVNINGNYKTIKFIKN